MVFEHEGRMVLETEGVTRAALVDELVSYTGAGKVEVDQKLADIMPNLLIAAHDVNGEYDLINCEIELNGIKVALIYHDDPANRFGWYQKFDAYASKAA